MTWTSTNPLGAVDRVPKAVFDQLWDNVSRMEGYAINIKESPFNAKGDGTTDDTAAIQAAIQYLETTGGAVYFPIPGQYNVTGQIIISSYYPVSLISNMGSPVSTSSYGSYIKIGGNISGSVFKYSAPGARGTSGGGTISGLSFVDSSNIGSWGTQGNYTLTACLELIDFNLSHVENCYFHFILGSAIKSQYMIMSNIRNCVFRYCGTTSKPALWLASDSGGTYVNQSVSISDCKLEVNHSAPYIQIDRYSEDIKIRGCGFEATPGTASSNQYYIYNNSFANMISDCHFHANNGTSVYLDTYGDQCQISNCEFNSDPTTAPKLDMVSTNAQISNCIFRGLDTHTQINAQNGFAHFSNCRVYGGGDVQLGTYSNWTGGSIEDLTTGHSYAIVVADGSTVSGAIVKSCVTAGGIKLTGSCPAAIGNLIYLNGGIGLRNESSVSTIYGNRSYSNTGGDASFTFYPKGYSPNANFFLDASYPLQTSVAWNPGSIADGDAETKGVTVTGATVGDIALASFPMLSGGLSVSGMNLSASVLSNDTVSVTISNTSGSAQDLDNATLIVQVLKG
jgi:hypothetical protein